MITSSTKSRHFGHHFPGFFSKVLCSTTHMQVPYPKSSFRLFNVKKTQVSQGEIKQSKDITKTKNNRNKSIFLSCMILYYILVLIIHILIMFLTNFTFFWKCYKRYDYTNDALTKCQICCLHRCILKEMKLFKDCI